MDPCGIVRGRHLRDSNSCRSDAGSQRADDELGSTFTGFVRDVSATRHAAEILRRQRDDAETNARALQESEERLRILAARHQGSAWRCTTPIVLLTGCSDPKVERDAMSAGAMDFLVKNTVDFDRLDRTIRHAIDRGSAPSSSTDG